MSKLGRYTVSTLKDDFPSCAGLKKLDILKQLERCGFRHLGLLAKDILAERRAQNSEYDPGFSLFRERKLLSKMTFMLYNSRVEICAANWTYMSIAFLLKILNLSLNKTVTEGDILGEGHILFCLLKHLFNFTHDQTIVLLPVFLQVPLQSPGSPSSERGEA